MKSNVSLLRHGLRDRRLRWERIPVGTRSGTTGALLYFDGLVRPDMLREVREKLAGIRPSFATDAQMLGQWLTPKAYLFPTLGSTERPDVAIAALLEGRAVLLVEGSPVALIAPQVFADLLHVPADYYIRGFNASLERLLRFCGLMAWLGPVVMGRMAALLGPPLVILLVGGLVVALPVVHVLWALPLLPRNLRFANWLPLGLVWVWLVEPAVLGVWVAQRVDPASRRSAGRLLAGAVLFAAALLAASLWLLIADFGPGRAGEFFIPFIHVAEELGYSAFLEHVDTMITPAEILGGLLKLGIFLWLWCRLGQRIVAARGAIARSVLLVVEVAAAGVLAVTLFHNVLDVDRSLDTLAVYALPALVAGMLIPYGAAALRAAARRRV